MTGNKVRRPTDRNGRQRMAEGKGMRGKGQGHDREKWGSRG